WPMRMTPMSRQPWTMPRQLWRRPLRPRRRIGTQPMPQRSRHTRTRWPRRIKTGTPRKRQARRRINPRAGIGVQRFQAFLDDLADFLDTAMAGQADRLWIVDEAV